MYPLGKTMQLKLELFEDSLEKYKHTKGILKGRLNQEALQTGKARRTFSRGNPHPTVDGLFYIQWGKGKERWGDSETLKNYIATQTAYNKTDKRRAYLHAFNRSEQEKIRKEKWRTSEKGKDYYKKYKTEYQKTPKMKKYMAEWFRSDKGKELQRYHAGKKRAIKLKASEGLTKEHEGVIKQIYAHCARISQKLQIPFEVDHIVPLSIGGLHHPNNLQIAPASWNRSKHNRNTERWLPNGM
jgi:hypothetical protein